MKKWLLFLLIALVTIIPLTVAETWSEKQQGNIPLRIGHAKVGADSIFFIAEEKGYFKGEGLSTELTYIHSSQNLGDILLAGKIDIGCRPVLSFFSMEYNLPGKVKIAAMLYTTESSDSEQFMFITKADNTDLHALSYLKGKRLAVGPSRASTDIAKLVLQNLFDVKEITIINIPYEEHLTAVQSGAVDAAMVLEPIGTAALLNGGFKVIDPNFSRAQYIANPLYSGAVVVSADFLKKYPESAKKIQRALEKAIKFRQENEVESRSIIAKYTGYSENVAQKMHLPYEQISYEVDKDALQKYADIALKNGLIKGYVDTSKMLLD